MKPPAAPISAASTVIARRSWVQKRAAAAGVINRATIRISPTACSPITVTATTRASMSASRSATGKPCVAAYGASKQSRFSSLNSSTAAATRISEMTAISTASADNIEAVLP